MAWAGGPATPSCALKSGPQNWAHMEHQPRAPDETARCLHSEQGSPATSGSQQLSPRREALGSRSSPAPAPPPPLPLQEAAGAAGSAAAGTAPHLLSAPTLAPDQGCAEDTPSFGQLEVTGAREQTSSACQPRWPPVSPGGVD